MDKGPFHKDENDKNFDNKEDEDDNDFSHCQPQQI